MKYYNQPAKTLLVGFSLLLAFSCLSGCQKTIKQNSTTIRIGIALYQQDDTFITTLAQNLEQMAKEEEQARDIKLNLNITDSRSSQAAQNEQVDRFLSQGYDVICINIVDRTAAAVIIDKAQAAGVPVIFLNRQPVEEEMLRWEGAYYVCSQATQSGILQGHIVLDAWRKDSSAIDRNGDGIVQYVMLEGEPGHQDALLRTEYSVKVLTNADIPTEKLASDTADWQRGQAGALIRQWRTQYGDQIEVIFANNDDMALGAIDVYTDAGIKPEDLPFIVGVDATPPALEAIESGTLKGTVVNDAAGQARSVLDLACSLALGEDPSATVALQKGNYIWLPCTTITKDKLE